MASTDAKPVPQKNVAYRVTFPIMDADGDLVTGATGLDSEISKDGGTFADCTSEATEIATSSGVYYLDLTATEMNADTVAIIVKTSSSGAKTTTLVMYPEEAGDIRVNVTQFGGANGAFASGRPETNMSHIAGSAVSTSTAQIGVNAVQAGGTAWGSGAITAASIASDAITNAKIAADAIGASEIAADAIDASALATDAVTEIVNAVWAAVTRTLTANTNLNDLNAAGVRAAVGLASANLDTQLLSIENKTTNLPSDPADASVVAGLIAGVEAKVDTVDTVVDAIKAKTDQLAFTTASRVDAQVFGMQPDTVTASALAADAVAEINATVDVALADYDAPTHAELVSEINDVQADIAAMENLSAAQVNAEMVDVLTVDTYAEPGQGSPAATASLKDKIGYLFKAWRNKTTQTNSDYRLFADDGTTIDQKAGTSDDGTTFTRAKISSGP